MDLLTLSMAKKYTDSQRLGHTETKAITWDGNTEGKHGINMGQFTLTKASDVPINVTAENLKRMVFTVTDKKDTRVENIDLSKLDVFISPDGNNITIIQSEGVEAPLAMIFPETVEQMGEKGVYLLDIDLSGAFGDGAHQYVSLLETETIHQIDQKFIPGVILPVVELTTHFPTDGSTASLTAEESEQLTAAAKNALPIVAKFAIDGAKAAALFAFVLEEVEGVAQFAYKIGLDTYQIVYADGMGWVAQLTSET